MSSRLVTFRRVQMPGSHEALFTKPITVAEKLVEAGRDQRSVITKRRKGRPPFHYQSISHRGACGKARLVAHNRCPEPQLGVNGGTCQLRTTTMNCGPSRVTWPGSTGDWTPNVRE